MPSTPRKNNITKFGVKNIKLEMVKNIKIFTVEVIIKYNNKRSS